MSGKRFSKAANRLSGSIRSQGLSLTAAKAIIIARDYLYDFTNGVETSGWVALDELVISNNGSHSKPYQPTRVVPLRKFFGSFLPYLPEKSVLLDVGCGKGRVLLVASEFGFTNVRGIEFAGELCKIAIENTARYKRRTSCPTNFEIIEIDAMHYKINSDENIFFFFNPFGESILSCVLGNIVSSLTEHPRDSWLVFHNLPHPDAINQFSEFKRSKDFSFYGHDFTVYSNKPLRKP